MAAVARDGAVGRDLVYAGAAMVSLDLGFAGISRGGVAQNYGLVRKI
jgi:hypothetical protein